MNKQLSPQTSSALLSIIAGVSLIIGILLMGETYYYPPPSTTMSDQQEVKLGEDATWATIQHGFALMYQNCGAKVETVLTKQGYMTGCPTGTSSPVLTIVP